MTNNHDIERKMNFIVEQQAQFTSDIQKLQEAQARTEIIVAHMGETVTHMGEVVIQVGEAVTRVGEAVTRVADAVTRIATVTDARFDDVNAKINALVDSQIRAEERADRTDESLRKLIDVVERHIDEGKNGH